MKMTLAGEESSRFEQLRKLTEISRVLTYTTSVDQIKRLATSRAAELLRAERALLMLLDDSGLLQVSATHGIDPDAVQRFREPLDETLGRRVQGLLGISDAESFIGVPLVASGAVKGLLGVVRSGKEPCSEEEEWLLSAVADQVALAMETARLEAEVQQARQEGGGASRSISEAVVDKDRALATLSHDLRSPLNAIDSYAELLEMEILGPVTDRQREALGRIRFSGRHLLAVLQNVLEMARIESGTLQIHPTVVDLTQVVEEAADMVRHSAAAKNQRLIIEDGYPVIARADADRIRQVLVNLVGNAIKYTPMDGTIRVRIGRQEAEGRTWGTISVVDDGHGIPDRDLEAIFRPYYRVERSRADAPEGAGLGLAISRELVRQMGGDISVASRLGEGSTFTLRLPLEDSPHQTA
jgi:phosphoserine phosphatase RsbU/P